MHVRALVALAASAVVVVTSGASCPNGAQKKAEGAGADPMAMIAKNEQERAQPAAFAPFLVDEDAAVRARAVLAVARLEVLAALAPLAAAIHDADASVRANAAFGLG